MLRQPLMSDVRSAWAEMHQAGWDERRFHALREAGHSLLAGGRAHEAAEAATFLVSWEPLDEPSHLLLMRAFVEIGAPSRAAELFRDLRRRLRGELGVEPAPELAAVAGQPPTGRKGALWQARHGSQRMPHPHVGLDVHRVPAVQLAAHRHQGAGHLDVALGVEGQPRPAAPVRQ